MYSLDEPETDMHLKRQEIRELQKQVSSYFEDNSLRFAPTDKVYEIANVSDYSDKEFMATWYADKEYVEFQDHCEKTVEKMEQGKQFKDVKYCALGLAHWTRDGLRKQRRNRNGALDMVLNEQFDQWESGVEDPEAVAELYAASSQHCQLAARTAGLKIEREIQSYLSDSPFFLHKPLARSRSTSSALPKVKRSSSSKSLKSNRRSSFGTETSDSSKSEKPSSPRADKSPRKSGSTSKPASSRSKLRSATKPSSKEESSNLPPAPPRPSSSRSKSSRSKKPKRTKSLKSKESSNHKSSPSPESKRAKTVTATGKHGEWKSPFQ